MRITSIFISLLALGPSLWGANPWVPLVQLSNRTITVSPSKFHLSPSKAKLEIVESEGCDAKLQSSNAIQIGENCDFLRGVYQYTFKQPGVDYQLRLYTEFLIHQSNAKSRAFLVNSPAIVHEGTPLESNSY